MKLTRFIFIGSSKLSSTFNVIVLFCALLEKVLMKWRNGDLALFLFCTHTALTQDILLCFVLTRSAWQRTILFEITGAFNWTQFNGLCLLNDSNFTLLLDECDSIGNFQFDGHHWETRSRMFHFFIKFPTQLGRIVNGGRIKSMRNAIYCWLRRTIRLISDNTR